MTPAQLLQQRDALAAALRLMIATELPFAKKELGGLGLDYTVDNLTPEAWKARSEHARKVADEALSLMETR